MMKPRLAILKDLWLESDSILVVLTFSNHTLVPWSIRNRWLNCIGLTKNMLFVVGHIYREDNICADKLARFASSLNDFCWLNSAPIFIAAELNGNRIGLPNYRFSWFPSHGFGFGSCPPWSSVFSSSFAMNFLVSGWGIFSVWGANLVGIASSRVKLANLGLLKKKYYKIGM